MKLITELNESVEYIVEKKEDGKKTLFIEGVYLQSEIANRNGRKYSRELMEREVNRYTRDYIDKGRAFGELGHPETPSINLDRVSHIIETLKPNGSNWIGRSRITDTPMGNIARGIIESGGKLGVSSRGMGSLRMNDEGINEVQSDFHLATAADIVHDPSAPDAFVNGIMEGIDWVWENDLLVAHKVEPIAAKIKEEVEQKTRSRELNEQAMLDLFNKFLDKVSKI